MTLAHGHRKRRRIDPDRLVAALDIGSHKICCLICENEQIEAANGHSAQRLRPLGIGLQRSQGIVAGAVVDLRLAQGAIAAAVSQAEHAAGVRIERVVLGVGCGEPRSRTFNGHVMLPDGVVGDADIARLDSGAREFAVLNGAALLTLNRIASALDGTPAIREPRGLAGVRLDASHNAVTVAPGPLRNLCRAVESCQLQPAELLPSGYASALAATTESERRAGVVCIDLGAGLASIAGFAEGHFVFCASVPYGGQQVTSDLAQVLAVSLAEAERIKTLYGTLVPSAFDEYAALTVFRELADENGGPVVSRASVSRILVDATRALLVSLKECLERSGVPRLRSARVVLTGGASEMIGLESFVAELLGRSVRIAGPPRLDGVAVRQSGGAPSPAFSCVVGLAMAGAMPAPWIEVTSASAPGPRSYLGRVEQWLRQSF